MKTKEEILKEAEIEWGLRVGPKSNQREQTRVLLSILSKAIAQTREETIRGVEEKVGELRHELGQEESLDKTDREYFKEGHSECLNEVLDILNKL